ncbi:hypothetical protein ES708_34889 [subsurface metagenome]
MSRIDDFMSQVIDLDETEKEEIIRALASLFCHEPKVFPGKLSKNVMLVLIPFMSNFFNKLFSFQNCSTPPFLF